MNEKITEILERFKHFKDFERSSLDNIHASMSWWACFNPESEKSFPKVMGAC